MYNFGRSVEAPTEPIICEVQPQLEGATVDRAAELLQDPDLPEKIERIAGIQKSCSVLGCHVRCVLKLQIDDDGTETVYSMPFQNPRSCQQAQPAHLGIPIQQ